MSWARGVTHSIESAVYKYLVTMSRSQILWTSLQKQCQLSSYMRIPANHLRARHRSIVPVSLPPVEYLKKGKQPHTSQHCILNGPLGAPQRHRHLCDRLGVRLQPFDAKLLVIVLTCQHGDAQRENGILERRFRVVETLNHAGPAAGGQLAGFGGVVSSMEEKFGPVEAEILLFAGRLNERVVESDIRAGGWGWGVVFARGWLCVGNCFDSGVFG